MDGLNSPSFATAHNFVNPTAAVSQPTTSSSKIQYNSQFDPLATGLSPYFSPTGSRLGYFPTCIDTTYGDGVNDPVPVISLLFSSHITLPQRLFILNLFSYHYGKTNMYDKDDSVSGARRQYKFIFHPQSIPKHSSPTVSASGTVVATRSSTIIGSATAAVAAAGAAAAGTHNPLASPGSTLAGSASFYGTNFAPTTASGAATASTTESVSDSDIIPPFPNYLSCFNKANEIHNANPLHPSVGTHGSNADVTGLKDPFDATIQHFLLQQARNYSLPQLYRKFDSGTVSGKNISLGEYTQHDNIQDQFGLNLFKSNWMFKHTSAFPNVVVLTTTIDINTPQQVSAISSQLLQLHDSASIATHECKIMILLVVTSGQVDINTFATDFQQLLNTLKLSRVQFAWLRVSHLSLFQRRVPTIPSKPSIASRATILPASSGTHTTTTAPNASSVSPEVETAISSTTPAATTQPSPHMTNPELKPRSALDHQHAFFSSSTVPPSHPAPLLNKSEYQTGIDMPSYERLKEAFSSLTNDVLTASIKTLTKQYKTDPLSLPYQIRYCLKLTITCWQGHYYEQAMKYAHLGILHLVELIYLGNASLHSAAQTSSGRKQIKGNAALAPNPNVQYLQNSNSIFGKRFNFLQLQHAQQAQQQPHPALSTQTSVAHQILFNELNIFPHMFDSAFAYPDALPSSTISSLYHPMGFLSSIRSFHISPAFATSYAAVEIRSVGLLLMTMLWKLTLWHHEKPLSVVSQFHFFLYHFSPLIGPPILQSLYFGWLSQTYFNFARTFESYIVVMQKLAIMREFPQTRSSPAIAYALQAATAATSSSAQQQSSSQSPSDHHQTSEIASPLANTLLGVKRPAMTPPTPLSSSAVTTDSNAVLSASSNYLPSIAEGSLAAATAAGPVASPSSAISPLHRRSQVVSSAPSESSDFIFNDTPHALASSQFMPKTAQLDQFLQQMATLTTHPSKLTFYDMMDTFIRRFSHTYLPEHYLSAQHSIVKRNGTLRNLSNPFGDFLHNQLVMPTNKITTKFDFFASGAPPPGGSSSASGINQAILPPSIEQNMIACWQELNDVIPPPLVTSPIIMAQYHQTKVNYMSHPSDKLLLLEPYSELKLLGQYNLSLGLLYRLSGHMAQMRHRVAYTTAMQYHLLQPQNQDTTPTLAQFFSLHPQQLQYYLSSKNVAKPSLYAQYVYARTSLSPFVGQLPLVMPQALVTIVQSHFMSSLKKLIANMGVSQDIFTSSRVADFSPHLLQQLSMVPSDILRNQIFSLQQWLRNYWESNSNNPLSNESNGPLNEAPNASIIRMTTSPSSLPVQVIGGGGGDMMGSNTAVSSLFYNDLPRHAPQQLPLPAQPSYIQALEQVPAPVVFTTSADFAYNMLYHYPLAREEYANDAAKVLIATSPNAAMFEQPAPLKPLPLPVIAALVAETFQLPTILDRSLDLQTYALQKHHSLLIWLAFGRFLDDFYACIELRHRAQSEDEKKQLMAALRQQYAAAGASTTSTSGATPSTNLEEKSLLSEEQASRHLQQACAFRQLNLQHVNYNVVCNKLQFFLKAIFETQLQFVSSGRQHLQIHNTMYILPVHCPPIFPSSEVLDAMTNETVGMPSSSSGSGTCFWSQLPNVTPALAERTTDIARPLRHYMNHYLRMLYASHASVMTTNTSKFERQRLHRQTLLQHIHSQIHTTHALAARSSFSGATTVANSPATLLHRDLIGPLPLSQSSSSTPTTSTTQLTPSTTTTVTTASPITPSSSTTAANARVSPLAIIQSVMSVGYSTILQTAEQQLGEVAEFLITLLPTTLSTYSTFQILTDLMEGYMINGDMNNAYVLLCVLKQNEIFDRLLTQPPPSHVNPENFARYLRVLQAVALLCAQLYQNTFESEQNAVPPPVDDDTTLPSLSHSSSQSSLYSQPYSLASAESPTAVTEWTQSPMECHPFRSFHTSLTQFFLRYQFVPSLASALRAAYHEPFMLANKFSVLSLQEHAAVWPSNHLLQRPNVLLCNNIRINAFSNKLLLCGTLIYTSYLLYTAVVTISARPVFSSLKSRFQHINDGLQRAVLYYDALCEDYHLSHLSSIPLKQRSPLLVWPFFSQRSTLFSVQAVYQQHLRNVITYIPDITSPQFNLNFVTPLTSLRLNITSLIPVKTAISSISLISIDHQYTMTLFHTRAGTDGNASSAISVITNQTSYENSVAQNLLQFDPEREALLLNDQHIIHPTPCTDLDLSFEAANIATATATTDAMNGLHCIPADLSHTGSSFPFFSDIATTAVPSSVKTSSSTISSQSSSLAAATASSKQINVFFDPAVAMYYPSQNLQPSSTIDSATTRALQQEDMQQFPSRHICVVIELKIAGVDSSSVFLTAPLIYDETTANSPSTQPQPLTTEPALRIQAFGSTQNPQLNQQVNSPSDATPFFNSLSLPGVLSTSMQHPQLLRGGGSATPSSNITNRHRLVTHQSHLIQAIYLLMKMVAVHHRQACPSPSQDGGAAIGSVQELLRRASGRGLSKQSNTNLLSSITNSKIPILSHTPRPITQTNLQTEPLRPTPTSGQLLSFLHQYRDAICHGRANAQYYITSISIKSILQTNMMNVFFHLSHSLSILNPSLTTASTSPLPTSIGLTRANSPINTIPTPSLPITHTNVSSSIECTYPAPDVSFVMLDRPSAHSHSPMTYSYFPPHPILHSQPHQVNFLASASNPENNPLLSSTEHVHGFTGQWTRMMVSITTHDTFLYNANISPAPFLRDVWLMDSELVHTNSKEPYAIADKHHPSFESASSSGVDFSAAESAAFPRLFAIVNDNFLHQTHQRNGSIVLPHQPAATSEPVENRDLAWLIPVFNERVAYLDVDEGLHALDMDSLTALHSTQTKVIYMAKQQQPPNNGNVLPSAPIDRHQRNDSIHMPRRSVLQGHRASVAIGGSSTSIIEAAAAAAAATAAAARSSATQQSLEEEMDAPYADEDDTSSSDTDSYSSLAFTLPAKTPVPPQSSSSSESLQTESSGTTNKPALNISSNGEPGGQINDDSTSEAQFTYDDLLVPWFSPQQHDNNDIHAACLQFPPEFDLINNTNPYRRQQQSGQHSQQQQQRRRSQRCIIKQQQNALHLPILAPHTTYYFEFLVQYPLLSCTGHFDLWFQYQQSPYDLTTLAHLSEQYATQARLDIPQLPLSPVQTQCISSRLNVRQPISIDLHANLSGTPISPALSKELNLPSTTTTTTITTVKPSSSSSSPPPSSISSASFSQTLSVPLPTLLTILFSSVLSSNATYLPPISPAQQETLRTSPHLREIACMLHNFNDLLQYVLQLPRAGPIALPRVPKHLQESTAAKIAAAATAATKTTTTTTTTTATTDPALTSVSKYGSNSFHLTWLNEEQLSAIPATMYRNNLDTHFTIQATPRNPYYLWRCAPHSNVQPENNVEESSSPAVTNSLEQFDLFFSLHVHSDLRLQHTDIVYNSRYMSSTALDQTIQRLDQSYGQQQPPPQQQRPFSDPIFQYNNSRYDSFILPAELQSASFSEYQQLVDSSNPQHVFHPLSGESHHFGQNISSSSSSSSSQSPPRLAMNLVASTTCHGNQVVHPASKIVLHCPQSHLLPALFVPSDHGLAPSSSTSSSNRWFHPQQSQAVPYLLQPGSSPLNASTNKGISQLSQSNTNNNNTNSNNNNPKTTIPFASPRSKGGGLFAAASKQRLAQKLQLDSNLQGYRQIDENMYQYMPYAPPLGFTATHYCLDTNVHIRQQPGHTFQQLALDAQKKQSLVTPNKQIIKFHDTQYTRYAAATGFSSSKQLSPASAQLFPKSLLNALQNLHSLDSTQIGQVLHQYIRLGPVLPGNEVCHSGDSDLNGAARFIFAPNDGDLSKCWYNYDSIAMLYFFYQLSRDSLTNVFFRPFPRILCFDQLPLYVKLYYPSAGALRRQHLLQSRLILHNFLSASINIVIDMFKVIQFPGTSALPSRHNALFASIPVAQTTGGGSSSRDGSAQGTGASSTSPHISMMSSISPSIPPLLLQHFNPDGTYKPASSSVTPIATNQTTANHSTIYSLNISSQLPDRFTLQSQTEFTIPLDFVVNVSASIPATKSPQSQQTSQHQQAIQPQSTAPHGVIDSTLAKKLVSIELTHVPMGIPFSLPVHDQPGSVTSFILPLVNENAYPTIVLRDE